MTTLSSENKRSAERLLSCMIKLRDNLAADLEAAEEMERAAQGKNTGPKRLPPGVFSVAKVLVLVTENERAIAACRRNVAEMPAVAAAADDKSSVGDSFGEY